ncbi:hypothetical protein LD120_00412 [Mesoplasma sp. JKS002657]|nr:hypothetical protein [Mesoplasma sp. JKS002661]MCL8216154.1 hypothetical protein [Mesoplasma sp. JKS002657]
MNLSGPSEKEVKKIKKAFKESTGVKKRYRKSPNVLSLNYSKREVKDYFIYPLTTLTGKKISEGISVSKEKTTILVTTPDKKIETRAYLADDKLFSISEFADPSDPTQQLLKNSNTISFVTRDLIDPQFDILYLLTEEEITQDNFEDLDKYLSRNIDVDKNDSGLVSMTFQPLEDFTSLFKSQVIKILLMQPIKDKIQGMSITTPAGTLVGNIKAIDPDGHTISLLAKDNTEIFPNLVFPFQTKPNLGTVKYWNSKQIIPLKDIFDFLDSKKIAYDQEFSLEDFLKLGDPTEQPSIHFDNLKRIKFEITRVSFTEQSFGAGTHKEQDLTEPFDFELNQDTNFLTVQRGKITQPDRIEVSSGGAGEVPISTSYKELTPLNLTNIDIFPINDLKNSSGFDTVCQMMTDSFWKDMEFKGATKVEVKNGQKIETIDDAQIYALQEKYSGQDRYAVTTNLWTSWKQSNPRLVNENPLIVKRIENSLAMLSGYIKSNYSINKGDNDDFRVLLPYYFELQNTLDNPITYTKFLDIKVKLRSSYGTFTKDEFKFGNKDVSKNEIFELDYNHFVFPELTKTPETAQIPSSMPLDQELANGEFSKYQLKNFSSDNETKALILSKYGSGEMNYDPINNPIKNIGDFILQNSSTVSEIEISAFYGYGDWIITLTTATNKNIDLKLKLFSKQETDKTLISLII